jgi:c(7)-type cytochrome triheme protein
MRRVLPAFALCAALLGFATMAAAYWQFPPLPPPAEYGNILINRLSEKNGQKAVTFSHWSHRIRHTCKVCHLELGFEMRLNATEITEEQNVKGKFCGAQGCHDGKTAFGHSGKDQCDKCHNDNRAAGVEKFEALDSFPKTPFGNRIDWVTALKEKTIQPKRSLVDDKSKPIVFDKSLQLEAGWVMVPPVFFSHEAHNQWLDCSNCHPDIFNVKVRTTAHFAMQYILEGKFCGVCHLTIAFPINDCDRCHPGLNN